MKLLLDTHTFIWWASEPERLSKKVLRACENEKNDLFLSAASVWEMQIKLQLGKLELESSLRILILNQQDMNNLQILSVSLPHVLALENLPLHHRDPFDRLLIAQAVEENMKLVSKDKIFSQYPVSVLW
jgi:PIN domain nuclease of toxin-antitoxin system